MVVNTTSELGERKRLVNGGHFLKCPLFFWKMAVGAGIYLFRPGQAKQPGGVLRRLRRYYFRGCLSNSGKRFHGERQI